MKINIFYSQQIKNIFISILQNLPEISINHLAGVISIDKSYLLVTDIIGKYRD